MTSLEATNSVFKITNKKNSFSSTIPGHWNSISAEKTIDELKKLLDLKFQNDIGLHVQEVRKRGNQIKIRVKECNLSDIDTFKEKILKELKIVKYNDLEDIVCRMQLTYDEFIDILDLKKVPTKRTGYSLNPSIYEITDINTILK